MGLKDYLSTASISHLTSPPHTPEHNGYSKRRHRHIVEIGITLLSHASLPLTFWPHAFNTTVYLMSTPTLNLSTPFELIFKTKPNYAKLKIFRCLCYPWLRPYSSHKLAPKSTPCVFLGYSLSQSAYLCFEPTTSKTYVSRHVQFVESIFLYTTLNIQQPRLTTSYHNSHSSSSTTTFLHSRSTSSGLSPYCRSHLKHVSTTPSTRTYTATKTCLTTSLYTNFLPFHDYPRQKPYHQTYPKTQSPHTPSLFPQFRTHICCSGPQRLKLAQSYVRRVWCPCLQWDLGTCYSNRHHQPCRL